MKLKTKRAHWRRLITKFRKSGLSQRAFCDRHSLSIHTLRYWIRRFPAQQSDLKLLSVQVQSKTPTLGPVTLETRQGLLIHFSPQISEDMLVSIVSHLVKEL